MRDVFRFGIFVVIVAGGISYLSIGWHELFIGKYLGLLVAMAAGLFGATFSMLLQIQRRTSAGTLDDVETASNWHTLVVRCSFGVGAAAILYFFFTSGLLEGSLWPKLEDMRFTAGAVPNQHWCLLVIWSFLAGFSENFVPNILIKTEKKSEAT